MRRLRVCALPVVAMRNEMEQEKKDISCVEMVNVQARGRQAPWERSDQQRERGTHRKCETGTRWERGAINLRCFAFSSCHLCIKYSSFVASTGHFSEEDQGAGHPSYSYACLVEALLPTFGRCADKKGGNATAVTSEAVGQQVF